MQIKYLEIFIRRIFDFCLETILKKQYNNIFKVQKEKKSQSKIQCPEKMSFKKEEELKMLWDIQGSKNSSLTGLN